MDDPTLFANGAEYKVLIVCLGILVLSECIIMLLTSGGHKGSRKKSDRGSVWLIICAWCCSIMAGAYFRSPSMPTPLQFWLLPHFVYFIGIVFIIAGIMIRCCAVVTLKKAFTLSVQTTTEQHLITTGLYHLVRNPAYTGSMMSLLGVALAYRAVLGVVFVLVICPICYGIRIYIEEKALKTQFHDEWNQYCSKTKYWLIPGVF